MKLKLRTKELASVKTVSAMKHVKTLKMKVILCTVRKQMDEKPKKRRSWEEMQAEIDGLKEIIAKTKVKIESLTTEWKRKKVGENSISYTNANKEPDGEMHVVDVHSELKESNCVANIACAEPVRNSNHTDENLEFMREDFITVIRKRNREKREKNSNQ
ncbi:hypothetical protein HHI36_023756 [Cryptolaemus montrouzieri]|uniref:Uncharacterized protein n=1 Tax=Cryptolaemus montrouzieri TaxID=559131 RepID=A0ABD2PHG7_9CUCU